MTELLPCPFCGGEAEIRGNSVLFVQCTECGTRYGDSFHATKAEATAAWNTRYHCGLNDEDYSILLDELGLSERTCKVVEHYELPYAICSECGAIQPDDFTVYYCWACGAKVVEK